jgi:hypothetical protein
MNGINLGRELTIVSYGAASQGSDYRMDERIQHIAMRRLRALKPQCGTEWEGYVVETTSHMLELQGPNSRRHRQRQEELHTLAPTSNHPIHADSQTCHRAEWK